MDRNALMAELQNREISFSCAMSDRQLKELLGVTDIPAGSVTVTEEKEVAEFLPPKKKGGRPKKIQ